MSKIDGSNTAAIEELKKQVEIIMQEINLLKEQQALQTGMHLFQTQHNLHDFVLFVCIVE